MRGYFASPTERNTLIKSRDYNWKKSNMQKLTMSQVNKKYKGKYVEVTRHFDYIAGEPTFTVHKVSSTIKENMSLGEDIGTPLAYTR